MQKFYLYILLFLFISPVDSSFPAESWNRFIIDNSSGGADGVRLADVNADGLMDIATGWEEGGVTKIYLHPGYDRVKQSWPSVAVGGTQSVEDAVFADVNRDGVFDVISCCEGDRQTMNIHWGPSAENGYLHADLWKTDHITASINRMQWMFCVPAQLDKREGPELIAAGKNENAELGWFEIPEDPHDMDSYTWFPISPVGWVMSILPYDMDKDGDTDIVISDRRGELRGCRWLENPGVGTGMKQPWKNHFIGGRDAEVMFMTIIDYDRDGIDEVLVVAKPVQIFLFKRINKSDTIWEKNIFHYPENTGTAKAVAVGDIDQDGRNDIVFSCEHADSGKSGVMWMTMMENKWIYYDISSKLGMKYDRLELIDIDGDGDVDVLTTEERENKSGLGVIWYENPL